MYGNALSLEFDRFSVLATDGTWYKNVWELLNKFDTHATFGSKMQIQPVQEADRSIMNELSKYYSGRKLQALNIYQQYKKVIHLSCIVLCDGRSIDKACMSTTEDRSDFHKFPLQHPSQSDHSLWVAAIRKISLEFLTIPEPLGPYIRPPHKMHKWTTTEEGNLVHHEMILDGVLWYITYDVTSDIAICLGRQMTRGDNIATSLLPFYASIIQLNDDTILLHSWIKRYQEPEQRASTFWQTIFQDKNTSLWKHLHCDGDGSWIWQGLCCGTLLIVHDGSYIKEVSTKICSAVVMIQCTSLKNDMQMHDCRILGLSK